MAQSTINVRVDEELKKQFDEFCNETGLTISSAINLFITKVVKERQIPFAITADPFYSSSNMKYMENSIEQLKEGKVVVKTMEELQAMEDE